MIQRCAIAIATALAVLTPQLAVAFPLQVGRYGNNVRSFVLAERDGQLCFQGFVGSNLYVTASISRDRDYDGFFKVHETGERLYQDSLSRLLAGPIHRLEVYEFQSDVPIEINQLLNECLEEDDDFYEAITTVG